MSNIKISILCFFSLLSYCSFGQLIDDFESDLSNFTPNGGTLAPTAFFEISNDVAFTGNSSLRLGESRNMGADGSVVVFHNAFQGSYGTYSFAVFVTSDNALSNSQDINFIFKIGGSNSYRIGIFPDGSDGDFFNFKSGTVAIYKQEVGVDNDEALDFEARGVSYDVWNEVEIIHNCNGDIIVSINGQERVRANDPDAIAAGGIALGVYHRDIFFDDISFEPFTTQTVSIDTTICEGKSVTLFGSSFSTQGTYSQPYYTDGTSQCLLDLDLTVQVGDTIDIGTQSFCEGNSITIGEEKLTTAGNYTILTESKAGCDSTVMVEIEVLPSTLFKDSIISKSLCPDDDFLEGLEQREGFYFKELINTEGCDSIVTYDIDIINTSSQLPEEVFICPQEEESVILYPFPFFDAYEWSTGQNTNTISVDSVQTVFLEYTTGTCEALDSVIVSRICEPSVYVPNAFTPNGDGVNDLFGVITESVTDISDFEIVIQNRWGDIVFISSSIDEFWDGTFKGELANVGVYMYQAKYKGRNEYDDDYQFLEGDVTLLR